MKRHLCPLKIGAFALLFVLITCMWVRSYRAVESFGRNRYRPERQTYYRDFFHSGSGRLWFRSERTRYLDPDMIRQLEVGIRLSPDMTRGTWDYFSNDLKSYRPAVRNVWERLGFEINLERRSVYWVQQERFELTVGVPYWLLATLTALPLSSVVMRAIRRRRRARAGLCPRCGYDLRGSKASRRCPECGTAVPPGAGETVG